MKDQTETAFDVPVYWSSAPLRKLCSFHNGLWTGKKEPYETAHVIRNTNFTADGRIDLSDVAVLEVEARHLAKRRLQKNDIIIEKSGGGPKQPVGRVVLFDIDDGIYSFSNFTSAIRVEDRNALDPVYLHRVLYYWYISGRTEPLQRRSTGIRNLNFDAYKDLVVPLPPLEEQKRIVAVLDQAFAALDRARANAEANLADAGNMFACFLELKLDENSGVWPAYPMKNLGRIQTGGTPKASDKDSYGDYIPFIKPGDFNPDGTLETNNAGLSETGAQRARIVPSGSALMVCIGATIGKAGFSEVDVACNQQINSITPKPGVSGEFLYYQFLSPSFQKEVWRRSGQATLPIINKSKWSEIAVRVPESEEAQTHIIESLREMRRHTEMLMAGYAEKLKSIADLRQSLLQQAFSGRLTA